MRIPAAIRALFEQDGPFATAYLDVTLATENAAHEVQLRWQALREQLAKDGADETVLDAMASAVASEHDHPGRRGQLLVGAGGRLLLERILPEPPVQERARWAPLPDFLPYLVATHPPIPHVVVIADRTGADVVSVNAQAAALDETTGTESVAGSEQFPVHMTSRDDWSERHFQNRVHNTWQANAEDVAHEVVRQVAEVSARLVVVAGEQRARALLVPALHDRVPPGVEISAVTEGGRGPGADREALDAAVSELLLRLSWRDRRDLLERIQQGVSRSDYAAAGVDAVLAALREGRAETVVLLSDAGDTEEEFYFGPGPLEVARTAAELVDFGVSQPRRDRLDAVLLRAVSGSDADVVVLPGGHEVFPDGVAATLRWAQPPPPPEAEPQPASGP
jgi:Bacterial archaeo-eukaryotic release factor family 2